MISPGSSCLEGEDIGDQWIRESSMIHPFAVFVFFLLWKLHRCLGRTLFDDILDKSSFARQDVTSLNGSVNSVETNKQARISNSEQITISNDLWLQKEASESTLAERSRFFAAKGDQAAKSLQLYLSWRKQYFLLEQDIEYTPTGNEDQDTWNISTRLACKIHNVKKEVTLPQFVRTHKLPTSDGDLRDDQGARIFHVTPGRIDERLCATPTYATALAIYLDKKLSRESLEKIAVVLDVRGGMGWRNLNAASQLPFIQHTCRLLLAMFPERLSRAIVYPIPASFVWLWSIASRCIDPKTRNKIGVLSGTATIRARPPTDQMLAYMSEETATRLEQERVDSFAT